MSMRYVQFVTLDRPIAALRASAFALCCLSQAFVAASAEALHLYIYTLLLSRLARGNICTDDRVVFLQAARRTRARSQSHEVDRRRPCTMESEVSCA